MKGQYFSFDAIVASVIFIMAIVALLSYWHTVKSYLDSQNDQISKDALKISGLLFSPAFYPVGSTGFCSFSRAGFAISWDDRRIDSKMIDCFKNSDQSYLGEVFETPYSVSIKISKVSDAGPILIGTIGTDPTDSTNVIRIRRLGTIVDNGQTLAAIFDITLYS